MPASAVAERVAIPFRATAGDTFGIRVTKHINNVENGTTTETANVILEYDGEVLRASESGYRMRWTMRSARLPGSEADNAAIETSSLSVMKGIPFEFDTTAEGTPVRITNLDEIMPQILDANRRALKEGGREPTDEVMATVEKSFRAMAPAQAAQTFLPEATVLGSTQGLRMDTDTPERIEAEAPATVPNVTIKTVTQRRLQSYDRLQGWAVFTWELGFDPKSARDAAAATVRAMAPDDQSSESGTGNKAKDEMSAVMQQLSLDRKDTGQAIISLADGWTRKVYTHRRVVSSSHDQVVDHTEWWLIEINRRTKK